MDIDLPEKFVDWLNTKAREMGGNAAVARKTNVLRSSVGRYASGQLTRMELGTWAKFVRAFPELKDMPGAPEMPPSPVREVSPVAEGAEAPARPADPGLTDDERFLVEQMRNMTVDERHQVMQLAINARDRARAAASAGRDTKVAAAAIIQEGLPLLKGMVTSALLLGLPLYLYGYSFQAVEGGALLGAFAYWTPCAVVAAGRCLRAHYWDYLVALYPLAGRLFFGTAARPVRSAAAPSAGEAASVPALDWRWRLGKFFGFATNFWIFVMAAWVVCAVASAFAG